MTDPAQDPHEARLQYLAAVIARGNPSGHVCAAGCGKPVSEWHTDAASRHWHPGCLPPGTPMPLPMQARIRELEAERDQFAAGVALICCDERHDAKVRGLEAQLVISRAAAGERADILEGARDLLESAGHNGAHGDDWPDINPSLEALIAERDQLRAGMEAVWTRWFLNAHDGLTFREAMTGLATDVRAVLDGKPMNAGRTTPDNPLTSTNGVDNPAAEPHTYLSTGCLHGDHGYCQSNTGAAGTKTPAQCKFCAAPCCCDCHQAATP